MKIKLHHLDRRKKKAQTFSQTLVIVLLGFQSILAMFLIDLAQACGPGRAGGRRHPNRYRKYSPLVQRQYFPNTGENTLGASGRPEGAIRRHDRRFKELVQNWNPDIEFRDDERTGADRMMSQRLKEKLSVLAISVMNQWPNVKLRVIEGWDEDYRHSMNSLHYEGRAVDITTSDKDKTKYGMLARLAVEAGFDWVHYESRSHVHCSVRSERADDVRNNGCFDAKSLVETPSGQMEMSQLQTNDLVLTMNSLGELQFSPVLMWLDRDELAPELFVELQTKSGATIRLTSSHLIYVADDEPPPVSSRVSTLTPPPSQPQSPPPPGQLPTANSINDDLTNSANKSRLRKTQHDGGSGNNYYYYDISSGGPGGSNGTSLQHNHGDAPASVYDTSEPTATNGRATSESGQTAASSIETTLDSRPGSLASGRALEMTDYVYTIYARNALVGQYLLISSAIEERVEFESADRYASFGRGSGDRGSGSRLIFSQAQNELGTAKEKESLKNKKAKKVTQGAPTNQATEVVEQRTRTRVKYDQIVSLNFVTRQGIYAPLTREGNIIVNSIVASCYAVISDHHLAHLSMAPVRWFSLIYERIFGLNPEAPPYERTVDYVRRREAHERGQVEQKLDASRHSINQNISSERPNYQTTNSLNRTKTRHIHWYPILLYNIARFFLPPAYLY